MQKITSLAKRRGFVFPGSGIYGGLANTWDYGPLGARVLQNIRNLWWKRFVDLRDDIKPLESGIVMNPKVWEASGHLEAFTDPLEECEICHVRRRFLDETIEEVKGKSGEVRSIALGSDKKNVLIKHQTRDHEHRWAKPRMFNLMFKTSVGPVEDSSSVAYLRPETAQGMFVNFKNVLTTERPKLPFGLAQVGKAFRNEITPGNFIFRTLEFEQMEVEYFVKPESWEEAFENWKKEMWEWLVGVGVDEKKLRWRAHAKEELSHYSKRTEDIEFEFPWGWGEVYGLAYRGDFDLKNHSEKSGEDLMYEDAESKERFYPHVVEPTFGLNRTVLVLLLSGYKEEGDRTILKLKPAIAPFKAAIFPLVANKPELVEKARDVYSILSKKLVCAFDDRGNIGKRYFAQDEIGTPWCITIDYQTMEDNTVTVRDRDTTVQERVKVGDLEEWFLTKIV